MLVPYIKYKPQSTQETLPQNFSNFCVLYFGKSEGNVFCVQIHAEDKNEIVHKKNSKGCAIINPNKPHLFTTVYNSIT